MTHTYDSTYPADGQVAVVEIPVRPVFRFKEGWEDLVPRELIERPQWVTWLYRLVTNKSGKSKWSKLAMRPRKVFDEEKGKPRFKAAKSNDPATWGGFQEACEFLKDAPRFLDGVGFEFGEDGPYVGWDLDNCLNEDGTVKEWARTYYDRLARGYYEISPSGKGLKGVLRGTLPAAMKEGKFGPDGTGGVELYSRGRFFTITGDRHPDATSVIAENSEGVASVYAELEAIREKRRPKKKARAKAAAVRREAPVPAPSGAERMPDEEVLRRCRTDNGGERFRALYDDGDLSDWEDRRSEADFYLIGRLAFYAGAASYDQVERLVRGSATYRDKWDTSWGGAPHIRVSIERCIDGMADFYGDKKVFTNYNQVTVEGKDEPIRKAVGAAEIDARLRALVGEWPRAVGGRLFYQNSRLEPVFLDSAAKFFAWIDGLRKDGEPVVDWFKGRMAVPQERYFEHVRAECPLQYRSIETVPTWPRHPDIYYMCEEVGLGDGSHLHRFIDFFTPATDVDRQLIKTFILTQFWGGRGGARPVFIFTADDDDVKKGRGIGKSTVAQIVGEELGAGFKRVSSTSDMEKVISGLLSPGAINARVCLIDNLKSNRFSWADLEAIITAAKIDGHRMYEGHGERPNLITWVITVNGAALSKDMAERSVVVRMGRPPYGNDWDRRVREFARSHRRGILADIRAALESPRGGAVGRTRWSEWEEDVLAKAGHLEESQRVIDERRGDVDSDQNEAHLVRDHFAEQIELHGHGDAAAACVFFPNTVARDWLNDVLNEKFNTLKGTEHLSGLPIPELTYKKKTNERGWIWRGSEVGPGAKYVPLRKPSNPPALRMAEGF